MEGVCRLSRRPPAPPIARRQHPGPSPEVASLGGLGHGQHQAASRWPRRQGCCCCRLPGHRRLAAERRGRHAGERELERAAVCGREGVLLCGRWLPGGECEAVLVRRSASEAHMHRRLASLLSCCGYALLPSRRLGGPVLAPWPPQHIAPDRPPIRVLCSALGHRRPLGATPPVLARPSRSLARSPGAGQWSVEATQRARHMLAGPS